MAKIAGKNGRFRVNSVNIPTTRFSGTMMADILDATSTEGSGNAERVSGVVGGEFSADVVYNPAVTTVLGVDYGPVALMTPGTSYPVELFPVAASNTKKISGTAIVETHELTGEARGLFMARVTGKYTGTVTASGM